MEPGLEARFHGAKDRVWRCLSNVPGPHSQIRGVPEPVPSPTREPVQLLQWRCEMGSRCHTITILCLCPSPGPDGSGQRKQRTLFLSTHQATQGLIQTANGQGPVTSLPLPADLCMIYERGLFKFIYLKGILDTLQRTGPQRLLLQRQRWGEGASGLSAPCKPVRCHSLWLKISNEAIACLWSPLQGAPHLRDCCCHH